MAWMRVGLDVEAAGKQAEVQKEQESVTDWTLKQREGTRKFKIVLAVRRIGR